MKHETPKFLIIKKKYDLCKDALKDIYDPSEDPEEILEHLKKSSNKATDKVPIKDIFLSPLYRKGTLVLFLLVNFHEFTGYAYIILYSKQIFKQLGSESLTPRQANYLIGVVNFVATVASAFIVKRFGRRALLIPGHVLMGLINIVIALATKYNEPIVSVLFIMAFLVAY